MRRNLFFVLALKKVSVRVKTRKGLFGSKSKSEKKRSTLSEHERRRRQLLFRNKYIAIRRCPIIEKLVFAEGLSNPHNLFSRAFYFPLSGKGKATDGRRDGSIDVVVGLLFAQLLIPLKSARKPSTGYIFIIICIPLRPPPVSTDNLLFVAPGKLKRVESLI
jgi:hypothetical protein